MSHPLITLTTDFGSSDHFVGVMKGVIAGISPETRIVDITHEIAPYNLTEAAFAIAQTWSCFPKGSIHIVVVDPGVGTSRRPIIVNAGGHYFLAPDNGLLSMIYDAAPHGVRVILNPQVMRVQISQTFHGRDVFASAAAHLARGVPLAKFGDPILDYVRTAFAQPEQTAAGAWRGMVLKADRFGNLITNFRSEHFAAMRTSPFEIRVSGVTIRRLANCYGENAPGESFAIAGSSGYLEISVNLGSAANTLGCLAGAIVELEITPGR